MQNKPDLFVTLIIIYLALLTLCIAIYAILQLYVAEIERGTATNLMIWSATLFPAIALLYTLNSWKIQKSSEVLSLKAEKIYSYVHEILRKIKQIDRGHGNNEETKSYIINFRNSNLEHINIFHSMLEFKEKKNLAEKLKEFDELLSLFDDAYFNDFLFNKNKDKLITVILEIDKELIKIILHHHN